MDRFPVTSSNIKSIGYDTGSDTLEIEFANGGVYQYHKVPPDAFQSLMTAPSVGKHLHQHIKPHYEHTKLENI